MSAAYARPRRAVLKENEIFKKHKCYKRMSILRNKYAGYKPMSLEKLNPKHQPHILHSRATRALA
jgi:hypothetical protein